MQFDDGKGDSGIEYQFKIIAYIAGCLSKKNVQDYWIYTNREVDLFDDMIVKFTDGKQYFIYFCQIKYRHKQNYLNLNFRHFPNKPKRKLKTFIDLHEYLEKIHEIMNENERGAFLKELLEGVPEGNIEFWLFSNSSFSKPTDSNSNPLECPIQVDGVDCLLRPYTDDQSIFPPENKVTCYRFIKDGHGQLPRHLEKFYVFLNQPSNDGVASSIAELKMDLLTKEAAEHMINFVTLNLKRATDVTMLRKNIFETHLLSLCLTHSIVEPTEAFVMKPKLAKIWNDLVTRFDVTLTSSEKKPYLYGCLSQKIREHFGDFDWNKIIRGSNIIPEAEGIKEKLRELVQEKEIRHWLGNCDRIQDLLKTLWECEYLPLVLRGNFNVPLLNKFRYLGKNFLVLDDNEISNSDLRVFANAADIHEVESGEKFLKSIDISMQGREPIELFSILKGDIDLMKEFKCEHLLYLIREREHLIRSVEGSATSKIITENENYFYIKNVNGGKQAVPIIGKCFQDTEKYLKRRLCKPTVEETIFDSERKVICLLTGDLNSIDWTTSNYYKFLDESVDNIVSTTELQTKQNEAAFIGTKDEHIEGLWSKFLLRKHALLHIKVERGRMILLKYRNCRDLSSHVSFNGPIFNAETFFEKTSSAGITVITGEPGSGKSTLLRSLFNACDKHSFALFCDLKNYRQDLYESNKDLFKDPIDFILKKEEAQLILSNKPYSNLHLNFLRKFLDKTKQLVLFLDSFDEVFPEYEEQVLRFVRELNKSNRRCIIASRIVMAYILGEYFEVTTFKIDILSKRDIKNYLNNEIPEKELKKYPLEFRENPLFLNFLIKLKRENALPDALTSSSLYNAVIDKSIEHFYHEKYDIYTPKKYEYQKEEYLKIHKELALLEIFDDTVTAKLNLNYEELRQKCTHTENLKSGLIVRFNEKGPTFLHRTIAKFLVAEWLAENIDKDYGKSMYVMLLKDYREHTRHLLDDILCRNLALHQAVIQKDLPLVTNLCSADDKYMREVDKLNRSALDVAALYCSDYSREDLNFLILEKIVQQMSLKQINFFERNSGTNSHWTDYLSRRHKRFLDKASRLNLTHTAEMYFYCKNKISDGITWGIENDMLDTAMALLKKDVSFLDSYFRSLLLKVIPAMRTDLLFELIELKSSTNPEFDKLCRACRDLLPITEVSKLANLMMGYWGFTAIHIACMSGSADVVRELIRLGVDVNAVDAFGLQPFYYAIQTCSTEILTILAKSFKREANILDKWSSPVFPNYLHNCIRKKYFEIAKILLLDEGFNKDEKDEHGRTALHIALKNYRKQYQCFSIKQRTVIPKPDDDDSNINQIELLLKHKLNVDARDDRGETPLRIALGYNDTNIIEMLLRHGANPNIESKFDDRTPLWIAIENRNHEAVKLLLEHGADVNQADGCGRTALFALLTDEGNVSFKYNVAETLVKAEANINHQTNRDDTALMIASRLNFSEIATMLLENEAQVDLKNKHGNTALMIASRLNFSEIATMLLENEANVDLQNEDGYTALMIAIDKNFSGIATMLLENGAQVDLETKHGNTALHVAVRACFFQFLQKVSECDIFENDEFNIFEIIKNPDIQIRLLLDMEIIEMLLKGDTDNRDKIGDARARKAADLLKVLIDKEANVDAVNGRGRTALDIAIKYKTLIFRGERAAGSSDDYWTQWVI